MYRNVSRSTSPPASWRRVSKVDLDTIEELQDAWSKRYETLRDASPPPLLNSPRSLRACAVAKVSPLSSLQKLSLKQHLFCVLGNPHALTSLPDSATAEYRVLMQSALRSFREVAIGLGTSQEKLAAFIAFKNQEKLRVPRLASLRELRRQMMAAEVVVERKHHHQESEDEPFMQSGSASVAYHAVGQQGAPRNYTASANLWPVYGEGSHLRSRRTSASHHLEDSSTDVLTARGQSPSHVPWPPVFLASVESVNEGGEEDTCGSGPLDFEPTPSPSGKLPYTPRDVSVLNSSYFSNRSIQGNVSNPSGAPLPTSCPGTPSLSGQGATSATRLAKAVARRQQSRLARESSLDPIKNLNGEVSLADVEARATVELRCNAKQDLSIVSIGSSELERLLSAGERSTSSRQAAIAQPSAVAVLAARRGSVQDRSRSKHAVTLFHVPDQERSPRPATATAADERIHASSTTSTTERTSASRGQHGYTNHSNFVSQLVPKVLARPGSPRTEMEAASTSSCVQVAESSTSEYGKGTALRQPGGAASVIAEPLGKAASAELADTLPPSWLPSPPAITKAEESEGFLYHCANPSHGVVSFYAGGSEPLVVALKL
ncbi:hypothetical protein LSCM4_01027 [Leishmania orientalis]|uniref:Uncharacterized protein n=1 Tax=Leishmania orientalis TaxID=2249476 RepID=A0A836G4P3_9TRYP|nr:hypothetical protein LSCM4_01027 [Leishmania orientalis]